MGFKRRLNLWPLPSRNHNTERKFKPISPVGNKREMMMNIIGSFSVFLSSEEERLEEGIHVWVWFSKGVGSKRYLRNRNKVMAVKGKLFL